jgi:hypothetical protein
MSNEKLKEALKVTIASKEDGKAEQKTQDDPVLSDADMEDVAGGTASCPTWSVDDVPL